MSFNASLLNITVCIFVYSDGVESLPRSNEHGNMIRYEIELEPVAKAIDELWGITMYVLHKRKTGSQMSLFGDH